MAKKKEENLIVPKVELKTPFSKREEIPIKVNSSPFANRDLVFDEVIEDSLKQIGEDVDKEILIPFVTDEKEILQFEKLGLLDSIQTIERGKIDLIKECIENGQTLVAIVLLQQLQTGEQWKIQEIIQSLS